MTVARSELFAGLAKCYESTPNSSVSHADGEYCGRTVCDDEKGWKEREE